MLSKKINCWEYHKCSQRPHGKRIDKLSICRAATDNKQNGVNGGINGGRFCWVVVGSFGTRREQLWREECSSCPFLLLVEKEEGRYFKMINNDNPK